MSVQATVTGVTGPGRSITAVVFPNVSNINFDYQAQIASITYVPTGKTTPITVQVMLDTLTTISDTIAAGNHAWTLS